jgi:soluble lytic murein transglycosylase-like protein
MVTTIVSFLFLLFTKSAPCYANTYGPEGPPPTLKSIRTAVLNNDQSLVELLVTRSLHAEPRGENAESLRYLLGMRYRKAKRHNLSSESMTRVRRFQGPLYEAATYYEAEQDLLRGKPAVAIKECKQYETLYPEGRFLTPCLRITALAHADLAHRQLAQEIALTYDEESPNPISELVDLHLAKALKKTRPKEATRLAKKLYTTHTSVNIGANAEALLHQWSVPLPDQTSDKIARVVSLRDSGQREASISLYTKLSQGVQEDDLAMRAGLRAIGGLTGWRNRNWDRLATRYQEQYRSKPTSKDAWSLYRVYFRSGDYKRATDWATDALRTHAGTRKWRRKEDELAHTMMLHGAYGRAISSFDIVAERGGTTGRDAEFFAAFSAHQMGDFNNAYTRLTSIINNPKGAHDGARYWRSKTLRAIGDIPQALADENWLASHSPDSWYSQLLRKTSETDQLRDGHWFGTSAEPTNDLTPLVSLTSAEITLATPHHRYSLNKRPNASTQLPWQNTAAPLSTVSSAPPWLQPHPQATSPTQYREHPLFNREQLNATVDKLIRKHGEAWPEIAEIQALSSVALTDESGARMAAFWKDYKEALRSRDHLRHTAAKELYKQDKQVRALMLLSNDNHNLAKQWVNVPYNAKDEVTKQFARMVANPLAHAETVWPASQAYNLDPMLLTALMRRESLFNPLAVSKVGARGAMQIMPRTGELLALHLGDVHFTTSDLEEPTIAIPYAASYLQLLLTRFEGVYPLAVAAYNAGPHNVGNWLNAAPENMAMDAFIEHIPYKETRRYVKGVTSSYTTIAAIYGDNRQLINIPHTLPTDHPDVVTF